MLLRLDPHSGLPLYRQMEQQIRQRIAGGQLRAGDQLPSARDLSAELKVNFLTVSKVYQLLEQDGLVEVRRGLGTFIDGQKRAALDTQKKNLLQPLLRELIATAEGLGMGETELLDFLAEALAKKEKRK